MIDTLRRVAARFRRRTYALGEMDPRLAAILRKRRGVFVEAGANDGLAQSNTMYLERHRGWRGLLIEPIPELYRRCVVNRPRCKVEHAALVPLGHPQPSVEMRYCNLMSLVAGAMKSPEADAEHLRIGSEVQNVETYTVHVPARPLSDILDKHAIAHVDFLSLDVEGFELQALQGLDFARHRPTYMLVEARFRDEIDGFLAGRYERVAELSHHDVLYRSRA